MTELAQQTLKRAWESLGVKETSPNDSIWIRIYLAFVNILRPAPWCSAFCMYKLHQGAKDLGIKSKYPKSGYVQSVYNWAEKNGYLLALPMAGSVFFVWHPELNRYAHIGFVKSVSKDGKRFVTIEGNSNTTGGREGTEVASNTRVYNSKNHKFAKII